MLLMRLLLLELEKCAVERSEKMYFKTSAQKNVSASQNLVHIQIFKPPKISRQPSSKPLHKINIFSKIGEGQTEHTKASTDKRVGGSQSSFDGTSFMALLVVSSRILVVTMISLPTNIPLYSYPATHILLLISCYFTTLCRQTHHSPDHQ